MIETVEQFLARGGKIHVLPAQKAKKSLSLSRRIGFKESYYNVGRKKTIHRELANKRAA